jgi:hypothetical protein
MEFDTLDLSKDYRLELCPDCEGSSMSRSPVGGVVENGPCDTCDGFGLLVEVE